MITALNFLVFTVALAVTFVLLLVRHPVQVTRAVWRGARYVVLGAHGLLRARAYLRQLRGFTELMR